MGATNTQKESFKAIRTVLISQPEPQRSPYDKLVEKYGLQIDWRPFIHVEGVPEKEFRRTRIRPEEFSAVVFTSKNSIEHYFRMCEEMRIKVDPNRKYFCLTEAIAQYLQKFIVYRKRKVFFGQRKMEDMANSLNRNKGENFLIPCSNLGAQKAVDYLKKNKFNYQEAMMFQTVSSDLSDLSEITYDVLVFFSPLGIKSLYDNFPDFTQNDTRLAVYGDSTKKAVLEHKLNINIPAPAPGVTSMTMALENYLNVSNK